MTKRVLLDRDLTHASLDVAMGLCAQGVGGDEARAMLRERLLAESLGETARIKTVTALMRTWVNPDPELASLVSQGAAFSEKTPDSRPLHIGVLLATQPFFADQAAIVGRILAVQGEVQTPAIRTKMKAIWGPRRSVDVAVQRTVKTMRSVGMIAGAASDSESTKGTNFALDPTLSGWVVACLMAARGVDAVSVSDVLSAPELFCFSMSSIPDGAEVGISRVNEGGGRTVLVKTGH